VATRGADTEPHEQAPTERPKWHGELPMQPDPPGPQLLHVANRKAGLIGTVFHLVLEQVVFIALLQESEQAAERPCSQWAR